VNKKIGGQLDPHASFCSKSSGQNFEIAILFSIVERPKNYAFGDIMIFLQSLGKIFKLQNLPIIYVWYLLLGSMHVLFGERGGLAAFRSFHRDNFP